jgi:hypothetical protein
MLSTLLISILFLATMILLLIAGKWVVSNMTTQAKWVGETAKEMIEKQAEGYQSSLQSLAEAQEAALGRVFPAQPPDSMPPPESGNPGDSSLTFEEELALLPPSTRDEIWREKLEEEMTSPLEGAPLKMDPRAAVIDPTKLPSEGSVLYQPPTET